MAVDEVLVVLNNGGLFHNTGELDENTIRNLNTALAYWKANMLDPIDHPYLFRSDKGSSRLIITGGHSFEGRLMSSAMKEYLVARDIPQDYILEERKPSRDTFENIEGILPILHELEPRKITLITTGIHIDRAAKSFSLYLEEENLEIEIVPLPSTSKDTLLTLWEKGARLVYVLDWTGRGKSPLYRLARWFLFRKHNVPR